MKSEILFGIHPVLESLRAGRRKIERLFAMSKASSPRIREILAEAERRRLPVSGIDGPGLDSLTQKGHHQGVAVRPSTYPLLATDDLLDPPPPFLLLMDSIQDTQNMGALVRTALCAGVTGIIIPKDRQAPPSPAVSRASAGALAHARMAQATNLATVMAMLKKQGIWIFGLDGASDASLFQSELTGPLALVVGGEERGLRPLLKKNCDHLVAIPQAGPLDSLNASVAGAVAMYEAFRQRQAAKPAR